MNCERARSLWHDKCDNELSQSDAMSLEFHLRQCSTCRQFHEEMDVLADGLDELRIATETVGMPSGMRPPERSAGRWWRAVGSVAAMLAVVVGAALWTVRDDPGSGSSGSGDFVENANGLRSSLNPDSVEMIGPSRERYIPVRSETHQPGVQFFVLYEQAPQGSL